MDANLPLCSTSCLFHFKILSFQQLLLWRDFESLLETGFYRNSFHNYEVQDCGEHYEIMNFFHFLYIDIYVLEGNQGDLEKTVQTLSN